MRTRTVALVLWLGPGLGALATPVRAQPAPPAAPSQEDRDRANTLMDEGDEKTEKGDLAAALDAYQKAHAIMRVPTTGIEIARTLDKLGKLTAALAAAREVATSPPAPNEPAPFASAREQARALATALEARVPTLAIAVTIATSGARAEVSIDGRKMAPAEIQTPMLLDPGRYRVTAAAPDHSPTSVEVTLKERDHGQIALALAKLAPPPPPPTMAPAPPPVSPLVPTGFSIAGVGALAGAITGALALSAAKEAHTLCPAGRCTSDTGLRRAQDRYNTADALAVAADVSFGLAAVGLALGLYGIAATPAPADPSTGVAPKAAVAPRAGTAVVFIGLGRAAVKVTF